MFKYIMIHNPRVLLGWKYNKNYKNYLVTRKCILELHYMNKVGMYRSCALYKLC